MPFDFDAAVSSPFRMQPGLRRLAPGDRLLTPAGAGHRREKLDALRRLAPGLLCAQPGFDPRPALDALAIHASDEHPDVLQRTAEGNVRAPALGWQLVGDEPRPIETDSRPIVAQSIAAGTGVRTVDAPRHEQTGTLLADLPAAWRLPALLALSFEQDFAIVDCQAASIPWLAVCLPSSWRPADKVGLRFDEVHKPVADSQLLRAAGTQLMRLVGGPHAWERFVWTITASGSLQAHPDLVSRPAWPTDADPQTVAALAFWRTERQAFLPLPDLGQAVFTIQVGVTPLTRAITTVRQATAAHAAIASMSDAVLEYRGLAQARAPLLAWLDGQMRRSGPDGAP